MPVEFIGMIGTQHASEIHPPSGPLVDVLGDRHVVTRLDPAEMRLEQADGRLAT